MCTGSLKRSVKLSEDCIKMADQESSSSGSVEESRQPRPAPGSPIVTNKTLAIFGCVGGLIGISITVLGQNGIIPPVFQGMGIGVTFLVFFSVFILFIVGNLRPTQENDISMPIIGPNDEQPEVPESPSDGTESPQDASTSEDPSISQPFSESDKTGPSSPGSGPEAVAVVDPFSESDSGIPKTDPSTDFSANLDLTSLTSGSKGKGSDEDISDPIKPIKVQVGAESSQKVVSDCDQPAKNLKVVLTPHSTETVTTTVGQSASRPTTGGSAV